MKILMFTDVHIYAPRFSDKSSSSYYKHNRLQETLDSLNWVADMIEEHKPNLVVNLGDTFQNHEMVDTPSLDCFYKGFHRIYDSCSLSKAQLINLVGNHDQYTKDGLVHSMAPLKFNNKIIVVDSHASIENLGFISYTSNNNSFMDKYRELRNTCNIFFIHADIVGAMRYYNNYQDYGLNPEEFKDIKHVFSGHIHYPHTLGINITYVGSLMYHNFNDNLIDNPRGIVIYDSESDYKITRIENPKTSIYINRNIRTEDDIEFIKNIQDSGRVLLKINGAKEVLDELSYLKNKFKFYVESVIDETQKTVNRNVLDRDNLTSKDIIANSLNYFYPDICGSDREIIIDVGSEIMNAVKSNNNLTRDHILKLMYGSKRHVN